MTAGAILMSETNLQKMRHGLTHMKCVGGKQSITA